MKGIRDFWYEDSEKLKELVNETNKTKKVKSGIIHIKEPQYKNRIFKMYYYYLVKFTDGIINSLRIDRKYLDKKDIAELLGLSEGQCGRFLTESKKINAIEKVKCDNYFSYKINPEFSINSTYLNTIYFIGKQFGSE